jgi:hypothetical protein
MPKALTSMTKSASATALLAGLLAAGSALAQQCPPPATPTAQPATALPSRGNEIGNKNVNLNCELALSIRVTQAGDLVAWAQGYMAGLNFGRLIAGQDTRDIWHLLPPQIDHLTKVYCEQHPKDPYDFAIRSLYRDLPIVEGTQAEYQRRQRS